MIPETIPIKNINAVIGNDGKYLAKKMYPITPTISVKDGQRMGSQVSSSIGTQFAAFW
jgi:hypothetical protein